MTQETIDFLENNRVEIILGSDFQYLCFINGKGAYAVEMTFIEALQNGIHKYKQIKK